MNDSSPKPARFPVLRFLLGSTWFRALLIALVAVPLCLVLGVVKLWRTSPAGFTPEVKISGVNLVQSWALQRSAVKATANGQMDRALYSWRMAVAQNPANPKLSRGLLDCILKSANRKDHAGLAVQQALWLARLTGTNLADLALTTRVLQEYELHPLVADLLKPLEGRLSPPLASAYLRSLFLAGRVQDFGRFWREASSRLPAEASLSLYHTAYEAGWGEPAQSRPAWQELDAAVRRSGTSLLASKLSMMAGFRAQDVARYETAFGVATNRQADRLVDHVNRWRLYASVTNLAKARQLAGAFSGCASNAMETAVLARTYAQLDLRDRALQALKTGVPEFGDVPELWLLYADLLTEAKQWDTLLALANQMRQDRRVSRELAAHSYYLEGFAEAARQHQAQAAAAFNKVPEFELSTPQAAVGIGKSMLELGFAEPAKRVLLKYEDNFKKELGYWNLLYYSAVASKDEALLLSAAKEMYTLASTNWHAQYAYAAALLTLRIQPEESVRLTQEVLKQQPAHAGAKINYSLALVQNRHPDQAQSVLGEIDPAALSPVQSNALAEAQFEIHFARHEFEKARQLSERIKRDSLFPSEAKWLDQALEQISPRGKSSASG